MIIQVQIGDSQQRYTYNAPHTIRIGDMVDLPNPSLSGYGDPIEGRVTATGQIAAAMLTKNGYAGPIKAILGRSMPLHFELTARNKRELRQKLFDAIDALED